MSRSLPGRAVNKYDARFVSLNHNSGRVRFLGRLKHGGPKIAFPWSTLEFRCLTGPQKIWHRREKMNGGVAVKVVS